MIQGYDTNLHTYTYKWTHGLACIWCKCLLFNYDYLTYQIKVTVSHRNEIIKLRKCPTSTTGGGGMWIEIGGITDFEVQREATTILASKGEGM